MSLFKHFNDLAPKYSFFPSWAYSTLQHSLFKTYSDSGSDVDLTVVFGPASRNVSGALEDTIPDDKDKSQR